MVDTYKSLVVTGRIRNCIRYIGLTKSSLEFDSYSNRSVAADSHEQPRNKDERSTRREGNCGTWASMLRRDERRGCKECVMKLVCSRRSIHYRSHHPSFCWTSLSFFRVATRYYPLLRSRVFGTSARDLISLRGFFWDYQPVFEPFRYAFWYDSPLRQLENLSTPYSLVV